MAAPAEPVPLPPAAQRQHMRNDSGVVAASRENTVEWARCSHHTASHAPAPYSDLPSRDYMQHAWCAILSRPSCTLASAASCIYAQ
eukprot:6020270-Pleurochrysis_carterae.AAC.3